MTTIVVCTHAVAMVMPLTNAFQLTSAQESVDVSFSLTCNSSGGPVSSVTWTRDDILLDNSGPLVLTDASTASYTNVLEVNSRAPGTYTCQIRGPSHQVLSFVGFSVQGNFVCRSGAICDFHNVCIYLPAVASPLNVQATQASASAPVEVSWSPPSGEAATITGYRIFHAGRGIAFLPPTVLNDFVTSINLNLGQGTKVGQVLSIRAELSISQLPSELMTVTISSELFLMHKSHCIEF